MLNEKFLLLDKQLQIIENAIKLKIKENKVKMVENITKLDTLSPLKTLTRGYILVNKDDEKIIKSAKELNTGDKVNLRFIDGQIKAEII